MCGWTRREWRPGKWCRWMRGLLVPPEGLVLVLVLCSTFDECEWLCDCG